MDTLTKTEQQTQVILLVDDSLQDRETTVRALKKANIVNPIMQCEDGEGALDYLFRRGEYSVPESSPKPGIILLDINMPGTDGIEVLDEIKRDPVLKKIPVVMLTTSSDERDIDKCYTAGANSYVQKPVNFEGYVKAIGRLKDYWFNIVILPKREGK